MNLTSNIVLHETDNKWKCIKSTLQKNKVIHELIKFFMQQFLFGEENIRYSMLLDAFSWQLQLTGENLTKTNAF